MIKTLTRAELRAARVARKPDDYKGVFGHVLIAAGSRGMSGAAVMTCRAALRSGAGLVTLAVPASLQSTVAAQVPEAMTLGLPETPAGSIRSEAVGALRDRHCTVFAIGPGLSTDPETARFVVNALGGMAAPAVIDADALTILAAEDRESVRELLRTRKGGCVFTPHAGEMGRCLDLDKEVVLRDREFCAAKLAREWNGVTLLKGRHTLISDGKRTVFNQTGGPGLAKGGSGDVLTGLIAGLWAQMIASGHKTDNAAFMAAGLGAHLHGLAGELAEKSRTAWAMTAGDVIDNFSGAFRQL